MPFEQVLYEVYANVLGPLTRQFMLNEAFVHANSQTQFEPQGQQASTGGGHVLGHGSGVASEPESEILDSNTRIQRIRSTLSACNEYGRSVWRRLRPSRRCDGLAICKILQLVLIGMCVTSAVLLAWFHVRYVGRAGCLQRLAYQQICPSDATNQSAPELEVGNATRGRRNMGQLGDDLVVEVVNEHDTDTIGGEVISIVGEKQNSSETEPSPLQLSNRSVCTGIPEPEDIVYIYFARDLLVATNVTQNESQPLNLTSMHGSKSDNDAKPNRSLARYEWSRTAAVVALPQHVRENHSFVAHDLVCIFGLVD